MKTYTPDELKEVLRLHKLYLEGSSEGVSANLSGADLRSANLSGADLSGAYLRSAYLRSANLSGANLSGANLSGAYLGGAILRSANLYGANLRSANLSGANLRSANLYGANLSRADLSGANFRSANLYGADLSGADLSGAVGLYSITPEKGAFTAFKKLRNGVIAELEIPAKAARLGGYTGRKCRAEYAKVVAFFGENGKRVRVTSECSIATQKNGSALIYKVGKLVRPDKWDGDPRVECTNGIHFFLSFKEAVDYGV